MTSDMTTIPRRYARACTASLALLTTAWAAFSFAQPMPGSGQLSTTDHISASSIRSVTEADGALVEVARKREKIEARYVVDEQECHSKFFATSCIEQAKERRREAMSALRPIEIEANAFKRQARVNERDKALAERQEKDEKNRQEPIAPPPAPASEVTADTSDESSRKVQTTLFSDRHEKHEAKLKQLRVEDVVNAEKRAKNIAAYEKKKQDALERQKKVAQRKAEKEKKRNAKPTEDSRAD